MSKTYKHRFFSLLIGFSLIMFLASCVDTSVQNIPDNLNYRSKVRFVNEATADATVTIDNVSVGSVATGNQSSYVDAASGSRNIQATFTAGTNPDPRTIILDTERKVTVTIVEDSTGARSFVKTIDGYIWE